MYKFHLINKKRTSSTTTCDQVLSFGGKHNLRGKYFSFYYMFKTNFSGHNKILGAQKMGSSAPECPP